jgi:hypothetical protein
MTGPVELLAPPVVGTLLGDGLLAALEAQPGVRRLRVEPGG